MISIVAKNVVKEGKSEEFKTLAEELVIESRKEAGCISYSLYQDIGNQNILTFIEEWASKEAIELHNSSKHFTTIVPKFADLIDGHTVDLYKKII